MSIDVLTVSSKGQIVLPAEIRKALKIVAGSKLAVYALDDTIMLKAIQLPDVEEFRMKLDEAKEWAAEVEYVEEDVADIIKSVRRGKRKSE